MEIDYRLNREGRDEQRKRVDMKLKDVEFNPKNRIKLDDMKKLNEILCEIKVDEKGRKYKELAFFGDNMCKLDLSEVDFSDVSYNSGFPKCLNNTNAKINFLESYECKKSSELHVFNVDFKNVDLSENDFEKIFEKCGMAHFINCDLSGTGINETMTGESCFEFINCDLSKEDFEGLDVKIMGCDEMQRLIFQDYCEDLTFIGCNLSGTSIEIHDVTPSLDDTVKKALKVAISRKQLDKCIFVEVKKDGRTKVEHTILTAREKTNRKKKILAEYNRFKANKINETLDMIEAALKTSKGGRQTKTLVLEDKKASKKESK